MKIRLLISLALTALLLAFVSPASAQDGARIHLMHGIPDTNVDVHVAGEAVVEGFAFGDTADLSSFAGQTLESLQVKLAGTDTVVIDAGDTDLPADGNFTVIAHLDAEGNPTLGVFANDDSATAAGEGRLVVRHTAAAPAVDVLADGAVAFANLGNGQEASADLPVGTISASVVPTGAEEPVVIGPADLPINDGESLIVYAVGSLEDETLTVLTESITDIGTTPTAVNTGASPVNSTDGTPMIAIVVLALGAAAVVGLGGRRLATASR